MHDLKTAPEYFAQVWARTKTFEIRFDDRAYQPGDTVVLREYVRTRPCSCQRLHSDHATCERYTGRWVQATIGYLTGQVPSHTNRRGFEGHGYVVFALLDQQYSDELERSEPADDVEAALVAVALGPASHHLEHVLAKADPRAVAASVSRAAQASRRRAAASRPPRLAYSSETPAGDA